jgi:hypothetical protein
MDIQKELDRIASSRYAKKSDRKLAAAEDLSRYYKNILNGNQPDCLKEFNKPENRHTKLSPNDVRAIRNRYLARKYGYLRLAKEFGVSKSVVIRIIKNKSWKDIE